MKLHTLTEPLITLHDARGRIVFAAPLFHHSDAEVIYTQPWDWVETNEEKEKMVAERLRVKRASIKGAAPIEPIEGSEGIRSR